MTEKKDKVWILTFEYAGFVKVGGLGEVPANQAKSLKDKYDITVFIPSHGQLERLKKDSACERLPLKCVGQINPSFFGITDHESSYAISFYKFRRDNVDIIVLSGDNSFSQKFLDDNIVYNPDTFAGKVCLFSIGMRCYIEFLIDKWKDNLPDVVHLHDYHVVVPFIGIKQELAKYDLDVSSIITIHLLTWPKYEFNFYIASGIDETPISVLTKEGRKNLTFNEIYAICEKRFSIDEDYYPPSVEKIGAFVCDLVTTVSESYLKSDIIPSLGFELIDFKADYVWDGCDWEYDEIYKRVMENFEAEMREVLSLSSDTKISHKEMRRYLLTYKLGHLKQSPLINSTRVLETIREISYDNPFINNGKDMAFTDSGPLVITTGRISHQKGFETILEAIPDVIKIIPNAKFLFLILPTEYSLQEIREYSEHVKKYPNNLRIIFGLSAEVFHLAHIVADVYCALSRWEPFGIIALEAMASKLPVIATKVGGLQESVIDIRINPEMGTGILIQKNNPSQFTTALISLFKLVQICEDGAYSEVESLQIINQIPDEIIKSRVLIDKNYYLKIRENCLERVKNNFRWSIVSLKLIELYDKIKIKRD